MSDRPLSGSRILAALPDADRARLEPHLEHVDLATRQKLAVAHRPLERVYFVESGMVSVLSGVRGDAPVEVGLVGREGIANLPALLGVDRSPTEWTVQIAGTALALNAGRARELMEENRALNALVRRYAHAFTVQVASSVTAAARASVGQRLARWLLMAQDRLDGEPMPLTHEFLSMMLAVRRPSVTLALSEFEGAGWIERRRGFIVLLERGALLAEAGGFYGVAEQQMDRIAAEDGGAG